MAEGFEPYHVPQQSRRDKLRVVVQNHPGWVEHLQGCAGLAPLYDPSLFPSDLLNCASIQHQNNHPLVETHKQQPTVKLGANLMGFVGGIINASSSSSSSSTLHHIYMDPQPQSSSIHINPGSIQGINTNPFLYPPRNLRAFDHQTFNGGVSRPDTTGQGLSLSLSSHQTHKSSSLPSELNLQRYEPLIFCDKGGTAGGGGGCIVPAIVGGGGSTSTDLSRRSVPLGPFTGYASILKGSRFLKPAQQLLEELCDVGRGIYAEKITAESSLMDSPVENFGGSGIVDDSRRGGDGGGERWSKKWRLISMLDEVYRRYKYYYQQMQAVVASFESVSGLSNAAPYANLALKIMSKHFRSLKNAITDQLRFTSQAQSYRKDETPRFGNPYGLYSQRPVHNSRFLGHQPVWRPQRGLPERAVTVLRAWLFEHFLHPYPTDTDKLMLAKQTGLSRSQVSNWFINARVRLWKPMVEEIHMLETRQAQKASEHIAERPCDHLPPANTSLASENSSVTNWDRDLPPKHFRNGYPDISMGTEEEEPMNLSYENLSQHQHASVRASGACGGGGGGVSLTLGLHQNNGIGLSEPYPISGNRCFGLDGNGDQYVMGSFEAQNQQFGREFIGGQLLQDFVG